jgi:hypothetical protein
VSLALSLTMSSISNLGEPGKSEVAGLVLYSCGCVKESILFVLLWLADRVLFGSSPARSQRHPQDLKNAQVIFLTSRTTSS